MSTQLYIPGQERSSFSSRHFPINPVAPVIKIVFFCRKGVMALVEVEFIASRFIELSEREKKIV